VRRLNRWRGVLSFLSFSFFSFSIFSLMVLSLGFSVFSQRHRDEADGKLFNSGDDARSGPIHGVTDTA